MPRPTFLSQAADRARLPVALLSGFLGSGKTTLVNALLRDPRLTHTAVAVNEFGEIPLDRDLIDHGEDRTVVLANGCLCCNLAGDMEDAVMRLFSRRDAGAVPRFRRLIIEPSGLADPAPIAQAILRNPVMARGLRLTSIVTTVDAQFGAQQMARHPETRKQVALADQVVITKTDVAPADPLREAVAQLNPAVRVWKAPFGQLDAACLFPADFLDPAASATRRSVLFADVDDALGAAAGQTAGSAPVMTGRAGVTGAQVAAAGGEDSAGHLSRYASVTLTADRPLDWRAFETWLRRIRLAHADSLLRLKGILHTHDAPGPVVIHGIHHVLNAPVQLDAWPGTDRRSRLVLIADRATIAAARESWAAALPGLLAADSTRQSGSNRGVR